MTHILYLGYSLEPTRGGIERVTDTVGKALAAKGYRIFGAYDRNNPLGDASTQHYTAVLACDYSKNTVEQLLPFIREHRIELIINQIAQNPFILSALETIRQLCDIKIVNCLHTLPDYLKYELRMRLSPLVHKGPQAKIKLLVKRMLYPFIEFHKIKSQKAVYRKGYSLCDKYVLLSASFIDPFTRYASLPEKEKLCAIPNPLTYTCAHTDLEAKHPQVLIVSRMCLEKRIEYALEAWRTVERQKGLTDHWRLTIVGDGYLLPFLCERAQELKLKRVEFMGHSNTPQDYYTTAQIYLITSLYEGFGISITEAEQFGDVPIAMDSPSPLRDIITDGYNGVITPANDPRAMGERIISLISNPAKLRRMASNALSDCEKFNIQNITTRWINLINELVDEK